MDPLTASISIVLGKYALDKSAQLIEQVGPKAFDLAKQIFTTVLDRLRKDLTTEVIVKEFEKNPDIYQKPIEQKLDEVIKVDLDFTKTLKTLLDKYNEEVQKHASMKIDYQANLSGTGSVAQGKDAIATTATDDGIAISSVSGDVSIEGDRQIEADIYIEHFTHQTNDKNLMLQVAELKYQAELDRIDLEWDQERKTYLIKTNEGEKVEPTWGSALATLIFCVIFGSIWLYMVSAMSSQSRLSSYDEGPFLFFEIIGYLIILLGVCYSVYIFHKTMMFKEAESAYFYRRNRLSVEDFYEPDPVSPSER